MQNTAETQFGLYDDTNNHWALRHTKNGTTEIYYDGSTKINTIATGAEIQGSLTVDSNIIPDAANTGSVGTSSLNFNTGYFQKLISPEIERTGTITLDANGSGADVFLTAADNVILQAGAEETGEIYFRGNSGADTYRFAKSGQTAIQGFLSFESLTGNKTYTFPDSGGTIALTSSTVDTATNCSRSITGGNGLTGGGTLTANRTLNVGAGSGISVSADAVAVDSTVIRTTGNQSMSGTKTFDGAATFNSTVNIRSVLDFADGDVLRMGSSDDWTVTFNSNGWNYINQKANGIIFQDNGTNIMRLEDSGVFRPETDGTGNLGTSSVRWSHTYSDDATITNTLSVRGAIDLADNDILRFGSGDDCELFTNGSHMYMDLNSGIGNFYIRDGTTTRFTFDDAGHFTATGNIVANGAMSCTGVLDTSDLCIANKFESITGDYDGGDLSGQIRLRPGLIGSRVHIATFFPETSTGSRAWVQVGSGLVDLNGVYDNTNASSANVRVTSQGYVRRATSALRYKRDIEDVQDMYADNFLENARPVWFRSVTDRADMLLEDHETNWSHWGFIAEELHEIEPRLVDYSINEEGNPVPEGVQYDRVPVLLFNIVRRQRDTIAQMQSALEELQARIAALEAN